MALALGRLAEGPSPSMLKVKYKGSPGQSKPSRRTEGEGHGQLSGPSSVPPQHSEHTGPGVLGCPEALQ